MQEEKETTISDRRILAAVSAGDSEAFRSLFDQYSQLMFTFVFGLTHSKADAEEVVQDVFMKLWEARASLPVIDNPKAYIYRMARNKTLDMLAKKGRHENLVKEVWANMKLSDQAPEEILNAKESRQLIEDAIRKLTPKKQEIYRMSREKGLSLDEIAEVLGLSKQTVKNNLTEALKQVRSYIEEHSSLVAIAFWLSCFPLVL